MPFGKSTGSFSHAVIMVWVCVATNRQSRVFFGCVALSRTFLCSKTIERMKKMDKTYLQEVGERIASCRSHGFFSRKELARRADVPVQSIAMMERGERGLSIEETVKICRVLGCSIDYILTGQCGLTEWLRMNQKILNLPAVSFDNMEKIASAFWHTCPQVYR